MRNLARTIANPFKFWPKSSLVSLSVLVICFFSAASTRADVTFNNPKVGGYGLDYCRDWAKNCGWPAAHAFCRSKGFGKAKDFKWIKDNQKTRVISSGQVCDDPACDRIWKLVCEDSAVTFNNPKVGGYGLDYCRDWAKNCGWPAAHAFCRSKGFGKARDFKWVKDNQKTRVISSGQVCDDPACDRIWKVVCRR